MKKVGKLNRAIRLRMRASVAATAVCVSLLAAPGVAHAGYPYAVTVAANWALKAAEFAVQTAKQVAADVQQFLLAKQAMFGATQAIVGSVEKTITAKEQLETANMNNQAAIRETENYANAQEQYTSAGAKSFKTCAILAREQELKKNEHDANVEAKVSTAMRLKVNLYTENTGQVASDILKNDAALYCTDADVARGRECTANPDVLMQGAGTRADSLLSPAAKSTYSAQEAKAADDFITNLTAIAPDEMAPRAFADRPGAMRSNIERMHGAAVMSVAQHSLEKIKSEMKSIGAPNAAGYSADLSTIGLMQTFVDEKFGNNDYNVHLNAIANENGMMKELNTQLAFANWVGYRTFMQNDRLEVLLATRLAMSTKEDSQRQLAAARSGVGRASR